MKKSKELAKSLALAAVMLTVALLLALLLQGLTQCRFPDPLGLEGAEYLDSFSLADSTVVLQKSLEGSPVILMYQKNWLLPRYALMALYPAEPGFTTAVETPLAAYPITVEGSSISVGALDVGLRWPRFCATYGIGMLLFLAAQYILYQKLNKK